MRAIHTIGLLSGFCYTQFADTYQECNGLLYSDRTPKFSIGRIRSATRGIVPPVEQPPLLAEALGAVRPERLQPLDEGN